jgi:hypothetical protein
MSNSIRTPRQGKSATSRRIAEAVDDEEWQKFRLSLKGLDTESKLNSLREYYEDMQKHLDPDRWDMEDWPMLGIMLEDVRIRVDNYLKALARGGQLPKGVSLEQALLWDWNLRVIK